VSFFTPFYKAILPLKFSESNSLYYLFLFDLIIVCNNTHIHCKVDYLTDTTRKQLFKKKSAYETYFFQMTAAAVI
jgi:hypothetical protein